MARMRSVSATPVGGSLDRALGARADDYLNFLGFSGMGSTLSYEQTQDDDRLGTFQGFGSLGDATAPSITGIAAVDTFLYGIEDQLNTFKLAMTITTISSLAGAIAGVLLILDRRK